MNSKYRIRQLVQRFESFLQGVTLLPVNDISPRKARELIVSYDMVFSQIPPLVLLATYQARSEDTKYKLNKFAEASRLDLPKLMQLLVEVLANNPRVDWEEDLHNIEHRMQPHKAFIEHVMYRQSSIDVLLLLLLLTEKVQYHFAGFFSELCIHRQSVEDRYFGYLLRGDPRYSFAVPLKEALEFEYEAFTCDASPSAIVLREDSFESIIHEFQAMVHDMFAPIVVRQFVME